MTPASAAPPRVGGGVAGGRWRHAEVLPGWPETSALGPKSELQYLGLSDVLSFTNQYRARRVILMFRESIRNFVENTEGAEAGLLMDLEGTAGPVTSSEQELSRAIIEATVDEADFSGDRTRLVKYLNETG